MQIGSYNPLNLLPGSATATGKKDDADKARTLADAAAEATVRANAAEAVPEATPEQDAAGVVLSIQSDGNALPKDLVYGNGRQATSVADDADTAAMAQRYNAAVERNAGSNTSLSVDSNGVLLAKPVSAGEVKAQAFVHNAVTAMRDYADTQDRQKADKSPLADIQQKLAARFKLFA